MPPQSLRDLLFYNLEERSNLENLKGICFDLNIEYEDIAGDTRPEKARNLILYLEQRARVNDLIAWGRQNRAELVWDAPPTQPTPTQTDATLVSAGVSVLATLARTEQARPLIASFRADFETARTQIMIMRQNKQAHDLLHELEMHYRPLEAHYRRVADDPGALETVIEHVVGAIEVIARLGALAVTVFTGNEAVLVQQLTGASVALKGALDASNFGALDKPLTVMQRVLGRLPGRINSLLVAATKLLLQSGILAHMQTAGDALATLRIDAEQLVEFTRALEAMGRIRDRLGALRDRHDGWQLVDDDLRRIEASIADAAPGQPDALAELIASWQDVSAQLTPLLDGDDNAPGGALSLGAIDTNLKSAIDTNNEPRMRVLFSQFCVLARRRFYTTDAQLLEVCNDLQNIGDSLDDLLKNID